MATLTVRTWTAATGVVESTVETIPVRVPTLAYWIQEAAAHFATDEGMVNAAAGSYVVASELGELRAYTPEQFASLYVAEPPPVPAPPPSEPPPTS